MNYKAYGNETSTVDESSIQSEIANIEKQIEDLNKNDSKEVEGEVVLPKLSENKTEVAEEIEGLNFVFIGGGNAKKVEVKKNQSGCAESIMILNKSCSSNLLKIPRTGEVITYVYQGLQGERYDSVEIYPILKSGRICEKADSIKLIECSAKIGDTLLR